VLCVAAWNVHHVRALASSFVSGDDDYLFILFDGNYKVRASTSPATVLAAAAAAIVALLLSAWHAHALCFSHMPAPMALTDCRLQLHACSFWQLGWRVTSGKFRSGLLPQFRHQLRALLLFVECVMDIQASDHPSVEHAMHHGDI
jgi:hypothetical protein